MKITFIGGDERTLFAASLFAHDKIETIVCGFDINTEKYGNFRNVPSPKEAVSQADIAVLPLPYTRDGINIFAPFCENPISINEIIENLSPDTILLGGKLGNRLNERAIDYCEREDFAVLNALPTAESAVKIALEETKLSIGGMKAAILGFGRVGKLLAKALTALGADVTVYARKAEARAWAKAFFCHARTFYSLENKIGDFDCIFNTVPKKILCAEELSHTKNGAVIIELASLPGGIDTSYAVTHGIKIISAQGLPGKTSPKSAGKIVYEIIKEIIEEEKR